MTDDQLVFVIDLTQINNGKMMEYINGTLIYANIVTGAQAELNNKVPSAAGAKFRKYCNINHDLSVHKQRVLMHMHQGWNVRHGLCHIYMRYVYIYIYMSRL